MKPAFWLERWRLSQIGFHQSSVHPRLIEFWPSLQLPPASRVLVPLSGKSLDLLWLLAQGHQVMGVELSELAVEAFCMENGIPARRRLAGGFIIYEAPGMRLFCGDFFELTASLLGPITAVYDRASLISWAPERQSAYVDHLTALTTVGNQTLLITMEYDQTRMNGPPFSIDPAFVERAYGAHHAIRMLDRRDILGSEPRLKAKGLDRLDEVCYQLTRL